MRVRAVRPTSPPSYSYLSRHKAAFYLHYLTNKVFRIWWEVKTPKFRMFAYEAIYSVSMACHRPLPTMRFSDIKRIRSFRGEYVVRPRTRDIAIASPAFERDDVDHLLAITRELLGRFDSVVFLDIGADIGTYCITLGNSISDSRLSTVAYEPSSASCELLRTNIELNGLGDRINLRQTALGNSLDTECELATYFDETGDSSILSVQSRPHHTERVRLTRLDDEELLIRQHSAVQAIVIKIDCEGAETDILAGGRHLLQTFAEAALLVEDFVAPAIVDYLLKNEWTFETKRTPYNSFWRWTNVAKLKGI
jgi:FkbM family methyltransferase